MQNRPTTKKGYSLFDVASCFQKSIRRGNEDLALKCAEELFRSNFDEYCWKRIKIIVSEDIGLAQTSFPAVIYALYQNYIEQKKKKDLKHEPERLFLYHAVVLCARAKKSRYIDWALLNYRNNYEKTVIEFPEWVYDKHTSKGRSMGRGIEHFYQDASKLENHTPIQNEDNMKKMAFESENSCKSNENSEFTESDFEMRQPMPNELF